MLPVNKSIYFNFFSKGGAFAPPFLFYPYYYITSNNYYVLVYVTGVKSFTIYNKLYKLIFVPAYDI